MTYIIYFLFVYGLSFFIVYEDTLDILKDKILEYSTMQHLVYKFFSRIFECQGCMGFWIGWVSQYILFGMVFPFYAFSCFGLISLINKIKE